MRMNEKEQKILKGTNYFFVGGIAVVLILIGLTVWAWYLLFQTYMTDQSEVAQLDAVGESVSTLEADENLPLEFTEEQKMDILKQLTEDSSSSKQSIEEKKIILETIQGSSTDSVGPDMTVEQKLQILKNL